MRVTVLAGGFGGAKMSHGFALLAEERAQGEEPLELTVIGNVADDVEVHGLHVSPDLDTVMYTLAGLANAETGWGVRDETWSSAEMLERYGEPTWFRLGDRDLATHVVRTKALRAGTRLTEVTARLARALGVAARLLPATDDPVRTKVRTDGGWLDFQDYFVRRGHRDEVRELRFEGSESAKPTPEVLGAIADADLLVLAPSNPFVSIGAILAVQGILDALMRAQAPVVAVSPIVAGAAVRGPADRMLASLGGDPSALGVARHYTERYPALIDAFVIDALDAEQEEAIARGGLAVHAAHTVMRTDDDRRRLADAVVRFASRLSPPVQDA